MKEVRGGLSHVKLDDVLNAHRIKASRSEAITDNYRELPGLQEGNRSVSSLRRLDVLVVWQILDLLDPQELAYLVDSGLVITKDDRLALTAA